MRALLDTHALLWWLSGDDALTEIAKNIVSDVENEIFVSAASAWEIATKHRLGKLPHVVAIIADLDRVLADQGFAELQISVRHGQVAGGLPGPHRDPFDRMLIAQALIEKLVLVSNERVFDDYGVARLW